MQTAWLYSTRFKSYHIQNFVQSRPPCSYKKIGSCLSIETFLRQCILSWCHITLDCFCREWTEAGQLWVQQVSSTPATRLDVITLQEELDRRLQQRQARETGICPVRRELYSQCFGNSHSHPLYIMPGFCEFRVQDRLRICCTVSNS